MQSRRGEYKDICSWKTHNRSRTENIVTSTDTDVVDLAISMFEKLKIDKLEIAFGKGKDLRGIPIHAISNALGPWFTILPCAY